MFQCSKVFVNFFSIFATGSPNSSVDLNRYRLGYSECINEVSRYLESSESGVQIRTQLIGHLANRCSPPSSPGPQQQPQAIAFVPAPSPAPIVAAAAMAPTSHPSVQLAQPSVPRGEIRVVLPPEALPNGQLPSHFIPVYAHPIPSPTSSTSSMETPTSPVPSSQQARELSSPVSYEHPGASHPLAYLHGVAPTTTSPPSPVIAQSPVSIQYSTEVPATEIRLQSQRAQEVHHQQVQQFEARPQPHFYYPDGAKDMQQNCAPVSADENVWRPW